MNYSDSGRNKAKDDLNVGNGDECAENGDSQITYRKVSIKN